LGNQAYFSSAYTFILSAYKLAYLLTYIYVHEVNIFEKMSHELRFDERDITDEEIVNAAEMNQELSFHSSGPSIEDEEEIEEDWDPTQQQDESTEQQTMTTRPCGLPKYREELKKTCSMAAEASFEIANFDGLIAM